MELKQWKSFNYNNEHHQHYIVVNQKIYSGFRVEANATDIQYGMTLNKVKGNISIQDREGLERLGIDRSNREHWNTTLPY